MVKAIEARGVGDLAKRALETTGQIFRYAIAHGHCKRNLAADIKPRDILKPTRKVNLARADAAELPGCFDRSTCIEEGHNATSDKTAPTHKSSLLPSLRLVLAMPILVVNYLCWQP